MLNKIREIENYNERNITGNIIQKHNILPFYCTCESPVLL